MTGYFAETSFSTSGSGTNGLLVVATSFPIRIANIDGIYRGGGSSGGIYFFVHYVQNASPSGGSSVVPLPLREGGPASTANVTARPTSTGGTSNLMNLQSIKSFGDVASYKFPLDLIIAPGGGLYAYTSDVSNPHTSTCLVYFEELRLSWSY